VAAVENGLRAPILGPAGNIVAHRNGALLAVRHGANARSIDSVLGEEITYRLRPLRPERNIVLARSTLVRVALDGDGVL